jgi:uracil-DNA glycosylase
MVTEPVSKEMLNKVKIDWEEFRERVRVCPECRRKRAASAVGLVAAKSQ